MAATTNPSLDMEHISTLLKEIKDISPDDITKDDTARGKLMNASNSLSIALEKPSEALHRLEYPFHATTIRVALDLDIFKLLKPTSKESPATLEKLASQTNADTALLSRILNHLASQEVAVIHSPSPNTFVRTPLSDSLAEPGFAGGVRFVNKAIHASLLYLPEYLAATGYRNPHDTMHGPFQTALSTKGHLFDWLHDHPDVATDYNAYMSFFKGGMPSWQSSGWFPAEQKLTVESPASDIALIDIGGGVGHDLMKFRRAYPQLPGRLMLQEQADVLDEMPSDHQAAMEAVPHDFFKPQPVVGARAYHMKAILHDWDDDSAVKILRNLLPAFKKGYSRLLVNELVVSDHQPTTWVTKMDLTMMVLHGVQERTEQHWRQLLKKGGFDVVKFWSTEKAWGGGGVDCLIEAVVEGDTVQ